MKSISSINESVPMVVHDEAVLGRIRTFIRGASVRDVAAEFQAVLARAAALDKRYLNLIASESLASPASLALLSHPIGRKMGGGQIGQKNRLFPASRSIDELESFCHEVFCNLFECDYVEYRLVSNMLAVMLVYACFTKPGDKVMVLGLPSGGDTSNSSLGPPRIVGVDFYEIPFDDARQEIDWKKFERMVGLLRPTMVSISRTVCLFSVDLRRIKTLISAWGGLLYLDAAHELGLIAGRVMSNPFAEGVDLVSGSIGKSFSGPQSGILLWNDSRFTPRILRMTFPTLVSSYQINRVAAITQAALELLEFGQQLMSRVVKNAQALARHLHLQGLPVLFSHRGFTETHQILLDVTAFGGGRLAAKKLADTGLLSNQIILPRDGEQRLFDPSGLRLGSVWVTRSGMGDAEMVEIAALISDSLFDRKSRGELRQRVDRLMGRFSRVYYCFENGEVPIDQTACEG